MGEPHAGKWDYATQRGSVMEVLGEVVQLCLERQLPRETVPKKYFFG
jgi:hypothetical protein